MPTAIGKHPYNRPLIGLIFHRVLIGLVVGLTASAVTVIALTRSVTMDRYRISLERDGAIIEEILLSAGGRDSDRVDSVFSGLSHRGDIGIGVYDHNDEVVYSSSETVQSISPGAFDRFDDEMYDYAPIRRELNDTDTPYLVIRRDISGPAWRGATHIVVARNLDGTPRDLSEVFLFLGIFVLMVLAPLAIIAYRITTVMDIPLGELDLVLQRLTAGELYHRAYVSEPLELSRLSVRVNAMASRWEEQYNAMRYQQMQLEAMLDNMVEGVILLDARLRIRSMNVAAQRFVDVDSEIGPSGENRTLLEVIRNSELHDLVVRARESGRSEQGEIVLYTTPPRYMQVHGKSLELDGEMAILLVLNDVTEITRLETIRRDFVANVSHELKTPVTSILGFVETLLDSDTDDAQETRHFLGIIAHQAQRLAAIIDDLLQLSRLERNGATIERTNVRIGEIFAAVRETVVPIVAEKQIRITDDYRGDITFSANRSLMRQAVLNLVDNAIKYCPPGSEIVLGCEIVSDTVTISVADNGPGVDVVDQPRIFERFYRTDAARSRSLGGTGLGLAIVKHIAATHGGTVAIESVPGRGSAFTISLPLVTT